MSNQLELRHIKYFLAVAKDLHFRKAAERLFISQPGLSRQIKQMEDDLGITLFERHNRKVELTRTGLYLQKALETHMTHLDHIFDHAKLLNDGYGGDLKLGYVGSAMQNIIPNMLLEFKNAHEDILFSLTEMGNQKQIESLLLHDIDLGFLRLDKAPRGIIIKPVLKEPFCLVLPANHDLNSERFKNIAQLKDASFILFDPEYSASYYENVMEIFDDSHFHPNVTHKTIHAGSIYKLVENGFGVSIVPKSLVSPHKNIKFIELTNIKQRTTLSVAWSKENRNPVLSKILDFV